jgi:hypothetical protein
LGTDIQSAVAAAKQDFGKPFFMEVMIMACWHIWKLRNGKIFQHERPSFGKWRGCFIHGMNLLRHRIKDKYRDSYSEWISSLP